MKSLLIVFVCLLSATSVHADPVNKPNDQFKTLVDRMKSLPGETLVALERKTADDTIIVQVRLPESWDGWHFVNSWLRDDYKFICASRESCEQKIVLEFVEKSTGVIKKTEEYFMLTDVGYCASCGQPNYYNYSAYGSQYAYGYQTDLDAALRRAKSNPTGKIFSKTLDANVLIRLDGDDGLAAAADFSDSKKINLHASEPN